MINCFVFNFVDSLIFHLHTQSNQETDEKGPMYKI